MQWTISLVTPVVLRWIKHFFYFITEAVINVFEL